MEVDSCQGTALVLALGMLGRLFMLLSLPGSRVQDRARMLRRWYDLMTEHTDDLAEIITRESGKALPEARAEVAYGAAFIDWYAEEGRRAYGDVVPTNAPDRRIICIKQPVGVSALITPWNFPNAMIARKVRYHLFCCWRLCGCFLLVHAPVPHSPLTRPPRSSARLVQRWRLAALWSSSLQKTHPSQHLPWPSSLPRREFLMA